MKLNAVIADYEGALDIQIEGGQVRAEVDGRRYELDLARLENNQMLLMSEGQVFECRVDGRPGSGSAVDVTVGAASYAVTLTDPKRLRSTVATGMHAGGAALIIAPMPGRVVRQLVEAGAEVEAGDGIVVVEAMKMQNEMKSPKAGKVVTMNVEVGATVNGGDVLAIIE
ncbi:MAG: biotin/lipoyl-containing protein [Pyrinomonadaceae bacterium]